MLIKHQFYLFGRIQTSQTGGQPYSDTSPYGEFCLEEVTNWAKEAWERQKKLSQWPEICVFSFYLPRT